MVVIVDKLNNRMLAWSTDWTALFGAERPLILEIGFGSGEYLLHLARTYPDANVIGVEVANRSLLKAEHKIERDGLTNIRAIHSTGETALHHLFSPASIWQIHINFPDPWFKADHHHRRLMQRDTLDAIASRLRSDGEFRLATDIHDYAEMVHDLLSATPGLTNLLPQAWAHEMPGRIVTKYEATARREGRDCYYFAYRRNDTPAPDVPLIKDVPMPHLVFASPMTLDEIAARFEPLQTSDGGINVHLMNAYVGDVTLLVETFVGEATISQHVALVIVWRRHPDQPEAGSSEYTIQLSMIGQPRPTEGIHRAVTLLADWVLSLHPQNRVLKQKVNTK